MQSGLGAVLGAGFARFAQAAIPRARWVVATSVVLALVSLTYAVLHLGIEGDNTRLLSEDLPFRRLYAEFERSFPILDNALLVVVDAPTSLEAYEATEALAERLRTDRAHVESLYAPFGGEFFQQHGLLYLTLPELELLSEQLARAQPVMGVLARDPSLRGLEQVLSSVFEQPDLIVATDAPVEEMLEGAANAAGSVFSRGGLQPFSWERIMIGGGFPGAPDRRLLIVQPVLDFESLLPARAPILAVRDAAQGLGFGEPGAPRARITGNQALNYEEMLTIVRETVLATALSFLVVAVILAFAIGSLRAVIHVLGTLVVGLACTAGFAALVVGHLNMVSLTCAVLFVGLGVDFGIHLVLRYGEARRSFPGAIALEVAARHVGPALLLCAISTAIGFFAFVPTDYRAVAELGLISGTGMFISFTFSVTLLPALLSLWPPSRPLREGRHRALGVQVANWPRRYPGRIVIAAAGLFVVALTLLPQVSFDRNIARLRDPTTESARTFDELLRTSDTSPWNIDVVRPDAAAAAAVAAKLADLDVVERAITLADFVPGEQAAKLELLEETRFILNLPERVELQAPLEPGERAAAVTRLRAVLAASPAAHEGPLAGSATRFAAELEHVQRRAEASDDPERVYATLERALLGDMRPQLELLARVLAPGTVALGDLPPDVVRDMRSRDGLERVRVFPAGDLERPGALERFVDEVRAVAPEATGSAISLIEWRRATVRSFRDALGIALALISILLWLRWRRVGDTLLVLVPLGLAAVGIAATTVAIGMPFNFINVVVIPLLLGIGVDSGIHLVERQREEGSAHLLESSTARAVFYSSLTTVGSFGTLALSSHRGLASMGVLLVIGLLYALAANLVVLPALIELRARHAARTTPTPNAS